MLEEIGPRGGSAIKLHCVSDSGPIPVVLVVDAERSFGGSLTPDAHTAAHSITLTADVVGTTRLTTSPAASMICSNSSRVRTRQPPSP
jgi:hypothetical protein